jgi:hypothetical protein
MGKNAIFIALLIVFDGVAVAWAAWEFWKARPEKPDQKAAPSPEPSRHAKGEHGADDR